MKDKDDTSDATTKSANTYDRPTKKEVLNAGSTRGSCKPCQLSSVALRVIPGYSRRVARGSGIRYQQPKETQEYSDRTRGIMTGRDAPGD